MSDSTSLTPMCYSKHWCHLSWTIKLNILSHLLRDVKVANTSLKVNMKLEDPMYFFGLFVNYSLLHVTPKRNVCLCDL